MIISNTLRGIVLFLILAIPSISMAGSSMRMPIDRIYDGDTIVTHFSTRRLPIPLNKVSIRIRGIDTPEKGWRAKCAYEKALALKARARVVALAQGHKTMKVTNFKWGKYGGRIVGTVIIGGVDVGADLIAKGLARPYFGKKKQGWCGVPELAP